MTCKEFTDFLMDYFENQLPQAARVEFERHVHACPPCLNYLDSYRTTVELGRRVCDADDDAPGDIPEELIQAILSAVRRG